MSLYFIAIPYSTLTGALITLSQTYPKLIPRVLVAVHLLRYRLHDIILPLNFGLPSLNVFDDLLPVIELLIPIPKHLGIFPDLFFALALHILGDLVDVVSTVFLTSSHKGIEISSREMAKTYNVIYSKYYVININVKLYILHIVIYCFKQLLKICNTFSLECLFDVVSTVFFTSLHKGFRISPREMA